MLRLLEFDAEIEHHGKVNAVIVVEQVGIRKMLPGQREDDLRIVLRLDDCTDADLCLECEVVRLLTVAESVAADVAGAQKPDPEIGRGPAGHYCSWPGSIDRIQRQLRINGHDIHAVIARRVRAEIGVTGADQDVLSVAAFETKKVIIQADAPVVLTGSGLGSTAKIEEQFVGDSEVAKTAQPERKQYPAKII